MNFIDIKCKCCGHIFCDNLGTVCPECKTNNININDTDYKLGDEVGNEN